MCTGHSPGYESPSRAHALNEIAAAVVHTVTRVFDESIGYPE
jgi:hypothetical protein